MVKYVFLLFCFTCFAQKYEKTTDFFHLKLDVIKTEKDSLFKTHLEIKNITNDTLLLMKYEETSGDYLSDEYFALFPMLDLQNIFSHTGYSYPFYYLKPNESVKIVKTKIFNWNRLKEIRLIFTILEYSKLKNLNCSKKTLSSIKKEKYFIKDECLKNYFNSIPDSKLNIGYSFEFN